MSAGFQRNAQYVALRSTAATDYLATLGRNPGTILAKSRQTRMKFLAFEGVVESCLFTAAAVRDLRAKTPRERGRIGHVAGCAVQICSNVRADATDCGDHGHRNHRGKQCPLNVRDAAAITRTDG